MEESVYVRLGTEDMDTEDVENWGNIGSVGNGRKMKKRDVDMDTNENGFETVKKSKIKYCYQRNDFQNFFLWKNISLLFNGFSLDQRYF